jgi:hypothetical protein
MKNSLSKRRVATAGLVVVFGLIVAAGGRESVVRKESAGAVVTAPVIAAAAVLSVPPASAATPAAEDHPLLQPEASSLTAAEMRQSLSPEEEARLAREMEAWKTRDARELVTLLSMATQEMPTPFPVTYLLSIVYAETHGKILAVSPAGAAGLAQAMPASYIAEGFEGKVFITNDYLIGTRAYVMKKPLGDAMTIADMLIRKNDAPTRAKAKAMLEVAKELRTEGIVELEVLEPHAPAIFMERVRAADRFNVLELERLERLIDQKASTPALRTYHTRVRKEYRALANVQRVSWQKYANELQKRRDAILEREYGTKASTVIMTRAYEAGELLGEKLDARFSPKQMAVFLARHLETKKNEAIALGVPEEEVDRWTAGLYNGGAHNVKRLRAGLLTSLRETQNYMVKIPQRKAILDRHLGS